MRRIASGRESTVLLSKVSAMLRIFGIYLAKNISRQHLLRFHPRQHKGRLDLDLRTRTHAVARVGRRTTSHWLGRWSGGNDRLPLWYLLEGLRGSKHRQWHDGGKSSLVQLSTRFLGQSCMTGPSEKTSCIAQSLNPYWQMLTLSPTNSIACCLIRNSRVPLPEI